MICYHLKNPLSVVPHITDAIQEWVMKQARVSVDDDGIAPEVCIIEVKWSRYCEFSIRSITNTADCSF